LLEQQGYIIIKKEDREFRIEKQYLQERESLDREKMMSEVKCPVLILHGDKDDTIPLEHSQSAIQYLPKGSKLEIIKGGSHRLEEDIGKLSAMVASWFKSHL
jgi:pimeloyl-ACP methyl ester carboxylesterase